MPCCLCTHCSLFLRCLSHLVHLANSYPLIKTQLRHPHLAFPFLTCAPTHSLCVPSHAPSHKHTEVYTCRHCALCRGLRRDKPSPCLLEPAAWLGRQALSTITNKCNCPAPGSGLRLHGEGPAQGHLPPAAPARVWHHKPGLQTSQEAGLSQVSTGTWEPLTRSASPHPPPHLKITFV